MPTLIAVAFLCGISAVAYYMANPVDWGGAGMIGAAALMFPLHLLVVAALGFALGALAWRAGATLAAAVDAIAALFAVALAVLPCVAFGRLAARERVRLSLGDYVAGAVIPNRGAPSPARAVRYGTVGGEPLVMDVWRTSSPGGAPHPAMIMIHGGGWITGRRGEAPRWNSWLNQLGFDVFDIDYRMPPPERWRDEVGDVKSAVGWVFAHSAEFGIDPARISVLGMSAGANLAMLSAYSAGDRRLPPSCSVPVVEIRSVINLYGTSDLAAQFVSGGSIRNESPAIRRYVGGTPEELPDRYRLLSPIHRVTASSPPTLTLLGARDRIVPADQATRLDRALAGANVPHETWLLPATDHGFDGNWGGFATQFARAKIRAFLQRHA